MSWIGIRGMFLFCVIVSSRECGIFLVSNCFWWLPRRKKFLGEQINLQHKNVYHHYMAERIKRELRFRSQMITLSFSSLLLAIAAIYLIHEWRMCYNYLFAVFVFRRTQQWVIKIRVSCFMTRLRVCGFLRKIIKSWIILCDIRDEVCSRITFNSAW